MIEQLIKYAHKAMEAGLVVSSSGNISVRLAVNSFAISSSGAYLGELKEEDISICHIDDPAKREGPEPSVETPLHRAIYLLRPDVKAILHFQSPYATTLACAKTLDFNFNFIPEVPAYLKSIKVIPYSNPGSPELTEDIKENIMGHDCNLLILRGHGQISFGEDLKSALRNAEFFELASMIKCQGLELNTYNPQTIKELQDYEKA
ncbi:MAG: class II aldolase/adducin family protein [Nitrospirae bacterium]|nr:class II aldolase/adducin family protein [Nitrospirota bacterium]